MKRVVVITGGAGYIGSHTAYLFAQAGYHVIVIDQLRHHQPFKHSWAQLIKADFASAEVWHALVQNYSIDAVVHCAALIEVGESLIHPSLFYENNVLKTLQLLEIMRTYCINRFIFSSSCALYGNPVEIPMSESHSTCPISPYGKTKQMVEYVLADYCAAYHLQYVSLRYFNAAGAFPEQMLGEYHSPETHVIPRLIHALLTNTPFKIYGIDYNTPDGTCIRDYIHVRDIAHAHLKALEHLEKTATSDVFNLGTGRGHSVKELIDALEMVAQRKLLVQYGPRREGDPDMLVANPAKAINILRWQPYFSTLDFILKSSLRFLDRSAYHQRSHNLA